MKVWTDTMLLGTLSLAAIMLIQFTLARRLQLWNRALVFAAVSAAFIVFIYVTPSPEPGFAGAVFAYNFSFFFPVLFSAFLFWGAALGFYIAFLRARVTRSPVKILIPAVLLLPFALQITYMIILFTYVVSSV
jgi:hypothetical protein